MGRGSTGLRAAALAGVALVAGAVALAVVLRSHHSSGLPAGAGAWSTALASAYQPSTGKSPCGVVIHSDTLGVAHPVLPCGVKLYLRFRGRTVLTEVIDRGHTSPGREFELTHALADLLRLQGTQTMQWRFAR